MSANVLQFLSQADEEAVCDNTLIANFLTVGASVPYMIHHSAIMKNNVDKPNNSNKFYYKLIVKYVYTH